MRLQDDSTRSPSLEGTIGAAGPEVIPALTIVWHPDPPAGRRALPVAGSGRRRAAVARAPGAAVLASRRRRGPGARGQPPQPLDAVAAIHARATRPDRAAARWRRSPRGARRAPRPAHRHHLGRAGRGRHPDDRAPDSPLPAPRAVPRRAGPPDGPVRGRRRHGARAPDDHPGGGPGRARPDPRRDRHRQGDGGQGPRAGGRPVGQAAGLGQHGGGLAHHRGGRAVRPRARGLHRGRPPPAAATSARRPAGRCSSTRSA